MTAIKDKEIELIAYQNTDREIYRGPSRAEWGDPDRFYADSIFVTKSEGIGIQCGGSVIVKPIRDWFALAEQPSLDHIVKKVMPLARKQKIPQESLAGWSHDWEEILSLIKQELGINKTNGGG